MQQFNCRSGVRNWVVGIGSTPALEGQQALSMQAGDCEPHKYILLDAHSLSHQLDSRHSLNAGGHPNIIHRRAGATEGSSSGEGRCSFQQWLRLDFGLDFRETQDHVSLQLLGRNYLLQASILKPQLDESHGVPCQLLLVFVVKSSVI